RFALLKYFDHDEFGCIETYINSNELFDALWQEWLKEKLISLYVNTSIINYDYEEMFNKLSVKTQNEILETKEHFIYIANKENTDFHYTTTKGLDITNIEKDRCEIVAQIFRRDLEKYDIILRDAGRFGFIMLEYYEPKLNFDCAIIFTDSQTLFDTLLIEWYDCLISELMEEKQAENIDIDDFYNNLSGEEKNKLENRKRKFINEAKKTAYFVKY
ncbi:MAG: hypothetical protein K2G55_10875, partial [Lachnospiraceae bacterium]|nr:hypothetical protein [Lachnospiraceae bacterium]